MFYQDVSPFSTTTLKKIVFSPQRSHLSPSEVFEHGQMTRGMGYQNILVIVCMFSGFLLLLQGSCPHKDKLFKMCFPPEGYPPQNLQGSRQANAVGKPKTFQASWIITVTVTLKHQARLSELMDKLDLSRLRINYRGLNELINTIISFIICLKCYWFLIFCFPNIGNFSPKTYSHLVTSL